jgi:hypothetical protein
MIALRTWAENNVLFVTTWARVNNLMMVTVGDDNEGAYSDEKLGAYLHGDGRLTWTGLATLQLAKFVSRACHGGPHHAHMQDLLPASELDAKKEHKKNGELQRPKEESYWLMCSQTTAALSVHYPVVVIQGKSLASKMKRLMEQKGAKIFKFNTDRFFNLFSVSKHEAMFGAKELWAPFLCLYEGALTVFLPICSVTCCIKHNGFTDPACGRTSTHHVLNVCRELQGLDAIRMEDDRTLLCDTAKEHARLRARLRENAAVKRNREARGNATDANPCVTNQGKGGLASSKLRLTTIFASSAATNGTVTCDDCGKTELVLAFVEDAGASRIAIGGRVVGNGKMKTLPHICKAGWSHRTPLSNCSSHQGSPTGSSSDIRGSPKVMTTMGSGSGGAVRELKAGVQMNTRKFRISGPAPKRKRPVSDADKKRQEKRCCTSMAEKITKKQTAKKPPVKKAPKTEDKSCGVRR